MSWVPVPATYLASSHIKLHVVHLFQLTLPDGYDVVCSVIDPQADTAVSSSQVSELARRVTAIREKTVIHLRPDDVAALVRGMSPEAADVKPGENSDTAQEEYDRPRWCGEAARAVSEIVAKNPLRSFARFGACFAAYLPVLSPSGDFLAHSACAVLRTASTAADFDYTGSFDVRELQQAQALASYAETTMAEHPL